jgi:hypothetical protein
MSFMQYLSTAHPTSFFIVRFRIWLLLLLLLLPFVATAVAGVVATSTGADMEPPVAMEGSILSQKKL